MKKKPENVRDAEKARERKKYDIPCHVMKQFDFLQQTQDLPNVAILYPRLHLSQLDNT
jgi:hypothetical protein